MRMDLEEGTADELFGVLSELIDRAKENQDQVVLSYILPIFKDFAQALIKAKKENGTVKKRYSLPKPKNRRQLS